MVNKEWYNITMKKTDLAYAAGIIDGEGCIYIGHNHQKDKSFTLQIVVGNTDEWLCLWLKSNFGGYVYCRKRAKPYSNFWSWHLQHQKARIFLELVLPYLQIKKAQAELAINFQGNKKRGRPMKESEALVLQEAQAILLKKMHKKV